MIDAPLQACNTLGVASTAARLVRIDSEAILQELVVQRLRQPAAARDPLTVLGGGSNVVLRSRLPGLVALMRLRGVRIDPLDDGMAHVTAAAGERWHDLVRRTLGGGWSGLENLALIPGSVGAAPIQNIGAYGVELAERFVRLRALDVHSGRVVEFDRAACRFGYRDSVFKHPQGEGLVILDVTLTVQRHPSPRLDYPDVSAELSRLGLPRPTPVQVAEAVIRIRRGKLPDPRYIGNVGSFFKNPVVGAAAVERIRRLLPTLTAHPAPGGQHKLSAAQLIDACGWKGRRIGSVGVWPRQPLVLCNLNGATGEQVLEVGDAIRQSVAERFGVALAVEPQVLGEA
ncbi:MAG: UDP-N-acetylmuramate dehydrogenase [Pseudomonadales bacterium]